MSNVSSSEIKREFVRSKIGLIGIGILACLIVLSVLAAITIPIDTFKQWNNPGSWISYPKTSVPVWVNYFMSEKIPEHLILDKPAIITKAHAEIVFIVLGFVLNQLIIFCAVKP